MNNVNNLGNWLKSVSLKQKLSEKQSKFTEHFILFLVYVKDI